jgi:hypothetical protein
LALLALAVLLVARYAKQILAVILIVGGLLALGVIAWAMLKTPSTPASTEGSGTLHDIADIARVFAPKSEPEPAYQTAPAPSGGGFVAGLLVALLIVALLVGGYFFARWKLAEWGGASPQRGKRRRQQSQAPAVYYIVPQRQDLDGLADLWDLEGLTQWNENELF